MPSVGDGKLKMSKWIPCLEAEVMWYTILPDYAQVTGWQTKKQNNFFYVKLRK